MRFPFLSCLAISAVIFVSALPARAETIDEFVFVAGPDTFSWSMPVPAAPYDSTPGVGDTFSVQTAFQNGNIQTDLYFSLSDPSWSSLYSFEFSNPTGSYSYTGNYVPILIGPDSTPSFMLGTFDLPSIYTFIELPDIEEGTVSAELTIGQGSASPVSEPSTIVLLGTGLIGTLGVLRRRFLLRGR